MTIWVGRILSTRWDGADLYEIFRMGDGYAWPPVGFGPDYEREFEIRN